MFHRKAEDVWVNVNNENKKNGSQSTHPGGLGDQKRPIIHVIGRFNRQHRRLCGLLASHWFMSR